MAGLRRITLALMAVLVLTEVARAQSDVEDVESTRQTVGANEQQTYFVISPAPNDPAPERGCGVLVVLPGGSGSAEFNPFVKRIARYAAPEGFLVVQLVATKWSEDQYIVWPSERSPVKDQQFTTEEFIAAVLDEVRASHKVDEDRLLLMGWSSSGPVVYNMLCAAESPFDGFYITMSVFEPQQMPPIENARGRRVVIEHSPDDRTCPFHLAEQARDDLKAAGAKVEFATYAGGHGWRGAMYPRMKAAFAFLLDPAGPADPKPNQRDEPSPDPAR